jgi:hypothetical protein
LCQLDKMAFFLNPILQIRQYLNILPDLNDFQSPLQYPSLTRHKNIGVLLLDISEQYSDTHYNFFWISWNLFLLREME